MTSFNNFNSRNRDMQDGAERHIFESVEYVKGSGSYVKVKGTGTEDVEAPVIHIGYGHTPSKGADAEVITLSLGSDPNLKFALVQIPADKQREWKEGRGGIQHPSDPTHALEFQDGKLKLTKGIFTVGENGTLEVRDGQIYFRGDMTITGKLTVNGGVITPDVSPGTDDKVPEFDAA